MDQTSSPPQVSPSGLSKKQEYDLRRQAKMSEKAGRSPGKSAKRVVSWAVVIALIVLVVGGLVWLVSKSGVTPIGNLVDPFAPGSDHLRGSASAKVVLVEYGDFQCPACGLYYPVLADLEKKYGKDLAVVYRHFPLAQHQYAETAALFAEAASEQGKFWEMHDKLFGGQAEWENGGVEEIFTGYAKALGLNMVKFNLDLKNDSLKNKIESDRASGLRSGVNSTPTFFVNNVLVDTRNASGLEQAIQEALAAPANATTTPAA